MGHVLYDVLEINIVVTAVILLLCIFAGKLRKHYGARWMKLMWIVLVIRLLIPYNFSLPFAEVRFFSMPGFEQETVQSPESVDVEKQEVAQVVVNQESLGVENKPVSQIQQGMTLEVSGTTGATQELDVKSQQEGKAEPQQETQIETPIQSEELIGVEVAPKQELNTTVGTSSEQKGQNTNILLIVWFAGMILFALYYISTYIGFQIKYKRSMKLLQEGALLEQINALQEECLGKVRIDVYQNEMAASPMLIGLFAPKLVLSANVEDCQSKEFRMIVLHELCHYQQKDLWLKLLVLCAHCLNWFNPALFFMKKQCFYDIELVCDMTVLEDCDFEERELYARTMLSFAKSQKQNVSFSTNFSISKKELKNRISSMFDVSAKKSGFGAFLLVGLLILGMGLFVSCGYKPEEVESIGEQGQRNGAGTEELITDDNDYVPESEKVKDMDTDSTEEASTLPTPTKDEVLTMRVKALEGMSEQEIERLKENIKVANQRMEKAYLYEDLFGKLSDPEHLYWNYFDQKGDIQIGWEPDGTPKMVYNRFDANNFVALMEEMRDSLKVDLLKQDFDNLIECTKMAKETHEVEYAEQIYRILHDMDYFLLRYGIEDVGKYLNDLSTVAKYYGVLEIYNKEEVSEEMTSAIAKILIQLIPKEEAAVSPEITQYSLEEAKEIGEVVELKGSLPGLGMGTWYIVTIDGVEHFYARYDSEEVADYYGYAIFSEDYELGCGIKVGMSREEILAKYPYTRIEDFEGNCLSDSLAPEFVCWNGVAYPRSAQGTDPNFEYNGKDYRWWNRFDYVMMLDIDLGTYDTLPIYLGLLMKEEKVGAITFYYPTAG